MVGRQLPAFRHAPYMTIVVTVRKHRNSCTIAKSPKKRHQNIATESATAVYDGKGDFDCYGSRGVVACVTRESARSGSIPASNKHKMLLIHKKRFKSTRGKRAPGRQKSG